MVFQHTNLNNDSKIVTNFFKYELENFLSKISNIKKWNMDELYHIVNKSYKIYFKKGEQSCNKRKLILLPSNQRCIAVLEKNGKKFQCTRKRPKDCNLCGLHSCKNLKHGCISDYNAEELIINEENLESQISKFNLEIKEPFISNYEKKSKTEEDNYSLYNLDYINNDNDLLDEMNILLINNIEYYYDNDKKIYQKDDDTLEEIGIYNIENNLIESY